MGCFNEHGWGCYTFWREGESGVEKRGQRRGQARPTHHRPVLRHWDDFKLKQHQYVSCERNPYCSFVTFERLQLWSQIRLPKLVFSCKRFGPGSRVVHSGWGCHFVTGLQRKQALFSPGCYRWSVLMSPSWAVIEVRQERAIFANIRGKGLDGRLTPCKSSRWELH